MPPSPAQELGTKIHAEMEDWLLHGREPEHLSAQYVTRAFQNYVEGYERVVEEPKDFDMQMKAAGVPVKGRIDLLLRPTTGRPLVVLDWKTSSNLRYAMSPEQLARDVQGVLYLKYAKESGYWASGFARFDHYYILTKGTGAKDVAGEPVTVEEVDGLWRGIEAEVEKMKGTETTPIGSVPGNLKHCDKYGGCAFRTRCPAANKMGPFAQLGEGVEDMSKLADILKARKAALGVVPPDAPVAAPVEVKAEPVLPAPPVKVEDTPEAWVTTPSTVEVVEVVVPEVVEERPKSIVEVTYARTETTKGLTLYVDCAPDGGGYGILEREIAERTPSLLEHLRKTAPKDVPEGAVDLGEVLFGRGYAALAASFVLKPLTGKWVVNSQYPASSRVLEVLTPKAIEIVRGRR